MCSSLRMSECPILSILYYGHFTEVESISTSACDCAPSFFGVSAPFLPLHILADFDLGDPALIRFFPFLVQLIMYTTIKQKKFFLIHEPSNNLHGLIHRSHDWLHDWRLIYLFAPDDTLDLQLHGRGARGRGER